MSAFSCPKIHNEEAEFAHLSRSIWNGSPVCPHCGRLGRIAKDKANPEKRVRVGLWRYGDCNRQCTDKIGALFEHMRLPLNKAIQAVYPMTSSKKVINALQPHHVLEITYKAAWLLALRIREAMTDGDFTRLGGAGGIVEVDDAFIAQLKGVEKRLALHHKTKVLALVDRNTGNTRTMAVKNVKAETFMSIFRATVAREVRVMADEHCDYGGRLLPDPQVRRERVLSGQRRAACAPISGGI
ncbi:IS1595 family transposase [Sphingomonas flavalba]|uniref:IS1595 family transposase n=1 Tax=Sphingomonas flavalba TaxID=2559804 RepID=UPI0039E1A6A2